MVNAGGARGVLLWRDATHAVELVVLCLSPLEPELFKNDSNSTMNIQVKSAKVYLVENTDELNIYSGPYGQL